jgi:mRNA-degrading endonuclease RelE of RelBE toxin-antitoxin system
MANYEIRTIENFDRELKKLAKKYPSLIIDLKEFVKSLQNNPTQGVSLGRDCYKVRIAITAKNKGKSGGARIITYVKILNDTITLVSIYDKSSQSDITDKVLIQLLTQNGFL